MRDVLVGAVIGGLSTLVGGILGGVALEAWRTYRAGQTAARLLFIEMLGNVRAYLDWQGRVEDAFERVRTGPESKTMAVQARLAIAQAIDRGSDKFYLVGLAPL